MTDARADPESESVETVNVVLKAEVDVPPEPPPPVLAAATEAQAALVGAEVPKELKALTV
jgi:hypothetical protein